MRRRGGRKLSTDGHVVHGVNDFNGNKIFDWSATSTIFNSWPPFPEVGVLDTADGAVNASRITADTPLDAVMANLDTEALNRVFGFPQSNGPFNVPIHEVATLSLASRGINEREQLMTFEESGTLPFGPYLSAAADPRVTLREWNAISGRISGRCARDGTSQILVELKDALPNALYSMWDIGVTNVRTCPHWPRSDQLALVAEQRALLRHVRGERVCSRWLRTRRRPSGRSVASRT